MILSRKKTWFRGMCIETGSLVHWDAHYQKPLGIVVDAEKSKPTVLVHWIKKEDMMMSSPTSWVLKRELKRVEGE